ncbi:MAG: nicotinamidase-like amidase [Planctomycetaceae bacterium]|nr:nicotinamidase-like amidase [Planctomycetaceae bacterium]
MRLFRLRLSCCVVVAGLFALVWAFDQREARGRAVETKPAGSRVYSNQLKRLEHPNPILAEHPEFIDPIHELVRYEAPRLVDDPQGDLEVRAWRFSYNARGIIEMPNTLRAAETAVVMVHPWGIDDGQGWTTPEPAGVCDFCTPDKNHFAAKHTITVINPFLKSLRGKVNNVLYSLPGIEDPIRKKLYRSVRSRPSDDQRRLGTIELAEKLKSFEYRGQPLPAELQLSHETPVIDYFRQFPGLDASAKFNNQGFWQLPIPVTSDITYFPDDVVIYDGEGYEEMKKFLKSQQVRHVLLTGYATDMCYCRTTAGYENLSKDFNVFLVGDATLATYPSNSTPAHATNAAISFAALNQLVTQVSWIKSTR